MQREQKIKKSVELFEQFTGRTAEHIDILELPVYDVGLVIGACVGVIYETTRDGKTEQYVHEFKKHARPVLAASYDGRQLYVLAGAYTFTPQGIVDKG